MDRWQRHSSLVHLRSRLSFILSDLTQWKSERASRLRAECWSSWFYQPNNECKELENWNIRDIHFVPAFLFLFVFKWKFFVLLSGWWYNGSCVWVPYAQWWCCYVRSTCLKACRPAPGCTRMHIYAVYSTFNAYCNSTDRHTNLGLKPRFSFFFLNHFPAFPRLLVTTFSWNSSLHWWCSQRDFVVEISALCSH